MKRYRICPECGKDIKPAGYRGHMIFAHHMMPPTIASLAANNSAQPDPIVAAPVATKEELPAEKPQEVKNKMADPEKEEQKPHDCPECKRREFKIVDLEHELDQVRRTTTDLKAQLDAAGDRPLEIPDLNTVIQHCESGECETHAKQWDGIKARIVQGAYDNIPDKLVESEGLKRGFIPKKIIIPVGR